MSEYLSAIWDELNAYLAANLGIPSDTKIVQAIKIERYDLRNLIANIDIMNAEGITMPIVICRFYPAEPVDWGMAMEAYSQLVEFIFIDRADNEISTTFVSQADTTNLTLSSTENIFVGQRLLFETTGVKRTVTAIAGSVITVDSAITATAGENVISQLIEDIGVRVEKLKTLFAPGVNIFTNFQIVEQGSLDVTDMNLINSALAEKNMALQAGVFKVEILYGNSY